MAFDNQTLINLVKIWFAYDTETGIVTYKPRWFGSNPTPRQKQWTTMYVGKECGFLNNGYKRVNVIPGKQLYIHQIAFILMKNYIPEEVDHEDTNKLNNKWSNLRDCTHAQNTRNVKKHSHNQSGLKGVSWSKRKNRWRMDIRFNNVCYYSFHFTKEEAYAAYCEASEKLHREFGNVQ